MQFDPIARPSVPRFLPRPDLCLVAGLAALAAAASFGGQSDSGGKRSRNELAIHTGRIEAVAFAPGGAKAASAGRDGTVRLWDVATRRERGTPFRGKAGFTSVAFAPDGQTLAVGGFDGTLSVLDAETG